MRTKNRPTIATGTIHSGSAPWVKPRSSSGQGGRRPVVEAGGTGSSDITRDPDTGVMNVGMYRGMIGKKNTSPFLLIKGGQHWGAHFVKWAARGKPMPVACVIG